MVPSIAFMGTNGGVSFSGRGFDAALAEIGQNTGNAMFQYALWERIANPKICFAPGTDAAKVRDAARLVLFPAANQVNPAWDLTGWAEFVEKVDLPCAMIGLGAQAEIGADDRLDLKEGTTRFIRAVAQRTTRIGVRGEFTRRVLANIGVDNTVVVGCPSQFINMRVSGASIADQLEKLRSNPQPRVGYVFGTMEPNARETERRLSLLASRCDHRLILQTDPRLLRYVFDGTADEEDRKYIDWIGRLVRPDLGGSEYLRYLSSHGLFFSDARTWIDRMASFDVVLGMRIHGAVAAIQAGKLGICVAFDSRTLELAETMGYPYIRAGEVPPEATIGEIVDRVTFDPVRFEELRKGRRETVDEILGENGCTVRRW